MRKPRDPKSAFKTDVKKLALILLAVIAASIKGLIAPTEERGFRGLSSSAPLTSKQAIERATKLINAAVRQPAPTMPCPYAKTAGYAIEDNSKHNFVNVGRACVDSACIAASDEDKLLELIQSTISQAASCMAALSLDEERLNSKGRAAALEALEQVIHDGELQDYPARALFRAKQPATQEKSFGLKNAIQLLGIYRSAKGLGYAWSPSQQVALSTAGGETHSPTYEEVLASTYHTKPLALQLFCSKQADVVISQVTDGIKIRREARLSEDSAGAATASVPGTPGWPLIRIRPDVLIDGPKDKPLTPETRKAMLFHEMGHLLGYSHQESNFSKMGGETAPVHTACQVCCFPSGNRRQFPNPDAPVLMTCSPAEVRGIRERACAICAGDYGVTHDDTQTARFKQAVQIFSNQVRACYHNLNPL